MNIRTWVITPFLLQLLFFTSLASAWEAVDISKPLSIGRANIQLPAGKWYAHTPELGKRNLSTGLPASPTTSRELVMLDEKTGEHLASAYISASNSGGYFYTTWGCSKNTGNYLREEFADEGPHHCLLVTDYIQLVSFFSTGKVFEFQKEFLDKEKVTINTNGYYIQVNASNGLGTTVQIHLLLKNGFTPVVAAQPAAKVPSGINQAIAAWADILYSEAKSSLYSFRGSLRIPSLNFTALVSSEKAIALAQP